MDTDIQYQRIWNRIDDLEPSIIAIQWKRIFQWIWNFTDGHGHGILWMEKEPIGIAKWKWTWNIMDGNGANWHYIMEMDMEYMDGNGAKWHYTMETEMDMDMDTGMATDMAMDMVTDTDMDTDMDTVRTWTQT